MAYVQVSAGPGHCLWPNGVIEALMLHDRYHRPTGSID